MAGGTAPLVLAGVALVGALGAAALLHQSLGTHPVPRTVAQTFFAGNYTTGSFIDVDDVNLDSGEYRIGYSFDVVYSGPSPAARLTCELKDPNGLIIRFEPDSSRTVRSSAAPQHVAFTGNYALPYVAVQLRCSPSIPGPLTAHFSQVHLDATLLTDGG
jgi:hypothetical protein